MMSEVLRFPVSGKSRSDEEACRALRASIYRARDAAHRRACDCLSLDAGHISHIASQFAAPWAFNRRASMNDLEQVLDALDHLLRGADTLEKLDCRNAK
jgi:hypothetical protein